MEEVGFSLNNGKTKCKSLTQLWKGSRDSSESIRWSSSNIHRSFLLCLRDTCGIIFVCFAFDSKYCMWAIRTWWFLYDCVSVCFAATHVTSNWWIICRGNATRTINKTSKKEKATKSTLILRRQIHFSIPTSSPLNQRERSNNAITLTVLCHKIIRTIKSRHFLSCIAFPSKKIFLSFDLQKPSCHQESGIGK